MANGKLYCRTGTHRQQQNHHQQQLRAYERNIPAREH
jgi:hypothetical protein